MTAQHSLSGLYPSRELVVLMRRLTCWAAFFLALPGGKSTADLVTDWQNVMIQAIRQDSRQASPTFTSRNMAIVHLAMYNAYGAATRRWQPYIPTPEAPAGTLAEAAVAQAAWRALASIYPASSSLFNAALAQSLATIPEGPGKTAGVTLGDACARAMIDLRANDGSRVVRVFKPTGLPGRWKPTEPYFLPGVTPQWPDLKPFMMTSSSQFRTPPPPALTSAEYMESFNQVKTLGNRESLLRTPEQTLIGIFWAYDRPVMGPPNILYNQIAQTISAQMQNTLEQNIHLYALINTAMADGLIACWEAKYYYDFWRPITAIREAGSDANPFTFFDLSWYPIGCPGGGIFQDFTPPFPSYPAGHSTFGAVLFRMLELYYGANDVTFTISSEELPGLTRTYHSFTEAMLENGISRIYLGVHWNFDDTAGNSQGINVADYVYQKFLELNGSASHQPWEYYE